MLPCRSTLFGPTCDGLDTIVREHPLPHLRNGDWVAFPSMRAYCIAGACDFNGFPVTSAPFFYVCSGGVQRLWVSAFGLLVCRC